MDLPEYHMRMISADKALVFGVSLNDQRRITWERCASISVKNGEVSMQNGAPVPQSLRDYCESWLACIARAKNENKAAYEALKAMGQLADAAGKLDTPIDGDLFEFLIWNEASLKDVLIANKGLALLSEDDQEKYILQGQHYMNEGKYKLAEAEFSRALEYSANQANVFSFLAVSLARQGKADEAASAINQSISLSTRSNKFLMRGTHYNLEAGNLEKTKLYIEQMAQEQSASTQRMLQVSRLAMRAGMKELGRELADAIVARKDHDENALEHLVNIVASTEGEKAVFKIIEQHVITMPSTPRLKEWFVRSLINSAQLELALQVTKDWVSQGANLNAQFLLGRTYLALNKPRSALRALSAAADLSPNHATTQKLIADACITLGDLNGAIKASGKACKLDPENTNFKHQAKLITDLLLAQSVKKP